jgi:hypothetical protein
LPICRFTHSLALYLLIRSPRGAYERGGQTGLQEHDTLPVFSNMLRVVTLSLYLLIRSPRGAYERGGQTGLQKHDTHLAFLCQDRVGLSFDICPEASLIYFVFDFLMSSMCKDQT